MRRKKRPCQVSSSGRAVRIYPWLKNAQIQMIQAIMEGMIAPNTTIYCDGYDIYNFVDRSPNYTRAQVCHSAVEYALDFDHDGIYETHVNTQDGAWSVLRPWIRPS